MSNTVIDADMFAAAMNDILDKLDETVDEGRPDVVREGAKTARREWSSNAKSSFGGTGAYASSIRFKVKDADGETSAEIGSATLPGLPHLLEKGHAKVGGGRVEGRPHVAPAAETAFEQVEEQFGRLVDRAIARAAS